ncbi:hypothetical protein D3C81_1205760 [compost metagenome]
MALPGMSCPFAVAPDTKARCSWVRKGARAMLSTPTMPKVFCTSPLNSGYTRLSLLGQKRRTLPIRSDVIRPASCSRRSSRCADALPRPVKRMISFK